MEKIKMILCDLDGTLLNSKSTVSIRTIETIQKVRKQGVLFGIATGRSPLAVDCLLDKWQIKPYVDILVGFNGGQYIDYQQNENVLLYELDGHLIKEIKALYEHFEMSFCIFDQYQLHATKQTDLIEHLAKGNQFELCIDDLEQFIQTQAPKLLIDGEEEVINEVEKFYSKHLDPRYRGVRSTKNLFEFLNPEVSKTKGIEKVAQKYNMTLENVCVFGDELNDLEMIRDCGVGVCMANGNPKVKAVANAITLSHDEDGVAVFIEDNFFK